MSEGPQDAEAILKERLARGEIDPVELKRRLGVVDRRSSNTPRTRRLRPIVPLVVVLVAGLAIGTWAVSRSHLESFGSSCAIPALSGSVVTVTLTDMGGGVDGGMMMGGMMRVIDQPAVVPAGRVSFRVLNEGSLTHELVVMPLPPGGAGSRQVGSDGKVDESGSLGEASSTCGAGAGQGIAPGAASWVTLNLSAGPYELICNLPGHYARGMYTELDVRG